MAMMWKLVKLSRILQPNGRAFKIPFGGEMEKLYKAIHSDSIGGMGKAYSDANSIMSSIFPDDPGFTIQDARDWYKRWGLYDSGNIPLADMKLALKQKRSFPLVPLRKQHHLYIQEQLQAAGFDVHVYKNKFDDGMGGFMTKTPGQILSIPYGIGEHGMIEHGDTEHGGYVDGVTLCVNYLEEDKDAYYPIELTYGYRSMFYIAGATVDAFADVLLSRKTEFRQLILKLKTAHMGVFLFVNYV